MSDKSEKIMSDSNDTPKETRHSRWIIAGFLFLLLVMASMVGAFAYYYCGLYQANSRLTKMMTNVDSQNQKNAADMMALQSTIDELKAIAQKSQTLSTQQEQMINAWQAVQQGNLGSFRIAEAQYLVRLADNQAQFAHNIPMALILLQQADQVLQNLPDVNLAGIRKSLSADIANLKTQPEVDISSLYSHLNAIDHQLDLLPFPLNPLQPDVNKPAVIQGNSLTWWEKGWNATLQTLKEIVVVRYNGSKTLPLVLPDEKQFFYQNLHAQMSNAMWAILQHNPTVYQISLINVIDWVKKYFVQSAPLTQNVLQNLQELQKVDIQVTTFNFATTLKLFENYFTQTASENNITEQNNKT